MSMEQNKQSSFLHMEHWNLIAFILACYDVITIALSYFLGLWIRFDGIWSKIPLEYIEPYKKFILFYCLICVLVYHWAHLYNSIWRFASYSEMVWLIIATAITAVFHVLGVTIFFVRMPMSYYIIGVMLQFLFGLGIRFSYRFILLERTRRSKKINESKYANVMVIGAGDAGLQLIKDIQNDPKSKNIVKCVIDDNPNKWNRFVLGVPVVGGRDDILTNVDKYEIDRIFVAMPSAKKRDVAELLNICKETRCELKNLPGIYQLVNGEVTVSAMKDVAVEDLLGRDPIAVNMDEIFKFISGKTVLVTGGGGSIGSELCRQIASHGVKKLIIFDIYENNAYDIQFELRNKYPELDLKVLIGSVRDSRKLYNLFETYKPDIVYHAAAHKHVPLMEDSPCESIKNNVMGTYKTAYAAMANGCQRFVLISTDKAVNPTNIMGASKRLCEMVIQTFDWAIKNGKESLLPILGGHQENYYSEFKFHGHSKTEYVAVRFGNVLGSNGSVIPLFKKQIAQGGPVTVTHPDIIRYFMTIPEAVSLVLQAGTYANGGEIFVLDMGEPVKIDTLARNLIKLSGFKPDVDIKIEYTGLRPGEKLYEEKLMAEEGLSRTKNDLIHIGKPIAFNHEDFCKELRTLMESAYNNVDNIREIVAEIVTTYHPERKG